MTKQYFFGQEALFMTTLFDKEYFWMKDGDGTIYLVRSTDGIPDFS